MQLSRNLIDNFAKSMQEEEPSVPSNIYATIVNGEYLRLDGAEYDTPYTTTIDVNNGDRVLVSIENHSVVIVGNVTSPSCDENSATGITLGILENIFGDDYANPLNDGLTISRNLYLKADTYNFGNHWNLNGSSITLSDTDDITVVENIDKTAASNFIFSLEPVKYKYNDSEKLHHGFTANSLDSKKYEDWAVYISDEVLGKGVSYTELIADLVATVQYQQSRINDLAEEIKNLKGTKN